MNKRDLYKGLKEERKKGYKNWMYFVMDEDCTTCELP
jgi:hypothetical protein